MVNPILVDYVKKELQLGKSQTDITNKLISQGVLKQYIDEIFNTLNQPPTLSDLPQETFPGKAVTPEQIPAPDPVTQEPMLQLSKKPTQIPVNTGIALPGPIHLLKQSFSIYFHRLLTFLGIGIIYNIILFVGFIAYNLGGLTLLNKITSNLNSLAAVTILLTTFIFGYALIISQLWGILATLYAIKNRETDNGIFNAFGKGFHRISSFFWISLLAGMIIIGSCMPFLIPGVIMAVLLSMTVFVFVGEDKQGIEAVVISGNYIKGRWWKAFGRLYFLSIINSIYYALAIGLSITFGSDYIFDAAIFLASIILTPISLIYLYLWYEYLKSSSQPLEISTSGKSKLTYALLGFLGFVITVTSLSVSVYLLFNALYPILK